MTRYNTLNVVDLDMDVEKTESEDTTTITLISSSETQVSSSYTTNAALDTKLLSSKSLSHIEDFILDGEVIAFQNGKPLHFQELQKRIHKKNVTEQTMAETPLVYVVFDIMYFLRI